MMDNKIKLLVIGLGVLAAVSLLIAFQLNITNNKLNARRAAIEQELAQVSQENEKLSKNLSAALAKNKTLTSQLEETEAKAKGIQEEIDRLKERLTLTSTERDSLIGKVQTLIEDKNKLQQELDKQKAKIKEGEKEGVIIPSTFAPTSEQEAFWAEVLRQKANAELELESVKAQLKEITYRADELSREKTAVEMELKSITEQKEDLTRRALYNEKLAATLSEDLVREKNDKAALLEQLDKLREDNRQMRARVKDLEDTKSTLYKKIDNIEKERNELRAKLSQTESLVAERVDEIVKIKSDLQRIQDKEMGTKDSRTVELSPIIVQGRQDVSKSALTGRILSVNKQNEFVVIDLGQNSGLKINDRFYVYRDNKFIAAIDVILMRKDIAAADIKEVASGQEIKVGDIVKLIQ